eukprot:SAG11_NODE_2819_length_2940_cov_31.391059_5_plen_220_part_00
MSVLGRTGQATIRIASKRRLQGHARPSAKWSPRRARCSFLTIGCAKTLLFPASVFPAFVAARCSCPSATGVCLKPQLAQRREEPLRRQTGVHRRQVRAVMAQHPHPPVRLPRGLVCPPLRSWLLSTVHDAIVCNTVCSASPDSVEHRIQQEYGDGGIHGHCECCIRHYCLFGCRLDRATWTIGSTNKRAPVPSPPPLARRAIRRLRSFRRVTGADPAAL